jgi:hypothetical protein
MIGWYLAATLFICVGFSVIGGSLFTRFGAVWLGVYWVVITFLFGSGCVWALGGGTFLGVLTFFPIMLCLIGLPTGLAMLQLLRRQRKKPQITSGQASTFLFVRSALLIPVGVLAGYAVDVAENLLRMASRG